MTLAKMAPTITAPSTRGMPCMAVNARISRGRSCTSPVGKRAEPMTAMATITVSRMTMPMNQPTTARVASFSDLAEKNFWYMD